MSTSLAESNKAFTFRSTNVGVKSLAMPYPKVIYLSIEPIGKSGQNVDLEINYWFTNNHQSASSDSSSSSSDSNSGSKIAKSDNQDTLITVNGKTEDLEPKPV
jgi:hypothetical protein